MNIKKTFRLPTFLCLFMLACMPYLLQAQPIAPQIDCASFSNTTSTISWTSTPNTDCNGAGAFETFVIYRSDSPDGPFTELVATAAPSPYQDELDGEENTLFYYYILTLTVSPFVKKHI